MISIIAWHSFRGKKATGLFKYYILGLFLLFLVCSISFIFDIWRNQKEYNQNLLKLRSKSTLERTYAILPMSTLAFISASNDAILPSWLEVLPYEVVDNGGKSEPGSYLISGGSIDWCFIIGIWSSLAAILFSSNSVSNRRTSRILRLYWSYPISRGQYFWGNFAGQFFSAYLPLLIFASLSLLVNMVFLMVGGIQFNIIDSVLKAIIVIISAIPYLGFFILVGWLTSLLWESKSASILGSLTIWVILVWMWPILGMMIGGFVQPLEHYEDAKLKWSKIENESLGSLSTRPLMKIVDSYANSNEKLKQIKLLETDIEREAEAEIQRADDKARSIRKNYYFKRKSQTEAAISLIIISPYGLWKNMVDILVPANFNRYHEFARQANEYSREFGIFSDDFKKQVINKAQYTTIASTSYRGYTMEYRAKPVFNHIVLPESAPKYFWITPSLVSLLHIWSIRFGFMCAYFLTIYIFIMLLFRKCSLA